MTKRTMNPVRSLTATELGLHVAPAAAEHASNLPDESALDTDDPLFVEVKTLLDQFGGVILAGPPGTSKSWYAARIGTALVDGERDRLTFTQFHPSYQYEDFMTGFVPNDQGTGFKRAYGHLLSLCLEATANPDLTYVLVIDELSRGDPGRVFGEALTYVEKSKRDLPFKLASGETFRIPDNLYIIATMNPYDRGVDEVDAAFERRFARIAMDPDRDLLTDILTGNGVEADLVQRVLTFFSYANQRARANPQAAIGHAYFRYVYDETDLERLWRYQLRFLVERAYRLDSQGREDMENRWGAIFVSAPAS
ncbi:AAA family ATPase [Catenulispora sp. NF23]|uniref:McrB family protein n=1 Tax=Catenulispora pinistramenti TaxID=2705254 RepID=UPI001BABB8F2|nr:AAA family ATPase [Catenulispora pinistramenti]MBS2533839.1 AAA family ATPase [Catenulispora pinistramenti]